MSKHASVAALAIELSRKPSIKTAASVRNGWLFLPIFALDYERQVYFLNYCSCLCEYQAYIWPRKFWEKNSQAKFVGSFIHKLPVLLASARLRSWLDIPKKSPLMHYKQREKKINEMLFSSESASNGPYLRVQELGGLRFPNRNGTRRMVGLENERKSRKNWIQLSPLHFPSCYHFPPLESDSWEKSKQSESLAEIDLASRSRK